VVVGAIMAYKSTTSSQILMVRIKLSADQPNLSCYDALKNFFEKYAIILGISCSAAFGVALLNIVMICCFCFHPSRAKGKRNLFRNLIEEN